MATPTSATGALPGAIALARPEESPARVRELAHEFEAMFLAQMLRQMRQSMALAESDEEGDGFGKAAFTDTFDTELARHLSRSGGLGIADVIIEAYERQTGTSGASGASGALDVSSARVVPGASGAVHASSAVSGEGSPADPSDAPAPGRDAPVALGPISSAFGWRRDPLTGQGRFHKGVDVKAAYGQTVPSVAGGTVLTAGTQGGYGLTVVVEHDSGIRTRYAHLSELAVRPGDVVARGQDLGRVGSSGRSTGPHLHFEVLEAGKPVNPALGLRKLAENEGFKEVRRVADSSIDRVAAMAGRGGVSDED
jgi:murein DD-endopeptidase MepM/ murein hydrolase activator NlpD